MSRISYSDEEEFPGQFALWQANCRRSLHSKAGREALREVEAALVAMPEKHLIRGYIEDEGQVCAIGAAIKARGLLDKVDEDDYTDDTAVELLGFPRLVAWKLVELNDEHGPNDTTAQRYERVLAEIRQMLGEATRG